MIADTSLVPDATFRITLSSRPVIVTRSPFFVAAVAIAVASLSFVKPARGSPGSNGLVGCSYSAPAGAPWLKPPRSTSC